MESITYMYAQVVLFGAYMLVSDGALPDSDTMVPCGQLLATRLCESLTFCSNFDYAVESSTCTFKSRSSNAEVRDCRILTTRRGTRAHLCNEKAKLIDVKGETVYPGDAVNFHLSGMDWQGMYKGGDECVILDGRLGQRKVILQSTEPIKKWLRKMKFKKGSISVFEPKKRIQQAISSFKKDLRQFRNMDFISFCFTGKKAFARYFQFGKTRA